MRPIIATRQLLAFGLIIALVIAIAIFALVELRTALTVQAHGDHRALAALWARILQERFGRLTDLNISLAGRVQFREEVEQGLWPDAMARMSAVTQDLPVVQRELLV